MHRNSVHVRLRCFNKFVALFLQYRHRGASNTDPPLAVLGLPSGGPEHGSTLTPKVRTEGKADGILYL